jgi:DNA polymerase III subunit beta
MKFSIHHKDIFEGLQKAQSIIERKEIKPILSNILLETGKDCVYVSATNLEVSVRTVFPATVILSGSIAVDARKLFEIIREMPRSEINFEKKENNRVELKVDQILFYITAVESSEFPEIIFPDKEKAQELSALLCEEVIEKTIFACSNDETRTNLNGLFFERVKKEGTDILRVVATDGYRLSMIDRPLNQIARNQETGFGEVGKGIIFPKRGIMELKKLVEHNQDEDTVGYIMEGNNAVFLKGNTALAIRIIDGEFPNYSQAIPEGARTEAYINTTTLLSALKRISVIAEEKTKLVQLRFDKDFLEISTTNPINGEGKEQISIDYKGVEKVLGFNARYLIDALGAVETETVTLRIKDDDGRITLTPANDAEHIAVIMPMEVPT